ncbi:MAG: PQQ-binding-like beta-propeller repeat protein, partial [Candidatus Poseidoniia archaeon]|nr:PQQ-binding-like beta-propeller repeat protein [Candidatus Poseidoniia archaeon]
MEIVYIPDEWNYGLVKNLQTGEEYGLISEAVEDASEGDELLVWPSLYEESIKVDKRLTITGLGPDVRVQGGFDATFIIEADGTVLQNLSIGNSSTGLVVNADDVILANLTISDISSEIEDEYAFLWDYTTSDDVASVSVSADGAYIVAGSSYGDGRVFLFDKDSSTPLWSYSTASYVNSVAISADSEYIAVGTAGWDGEVYLFDKDSSTPLWSYEIGSNVASVAISADGEYIVVGSDKVYLFDKDSSTPLWSYLTGDVVYSVSISADGKYIAAGSQDTKVYLFDKDSSTPLWIYDNEGAV